MPRYLISFDDGSMDHFTDADWVTVGEAVRWAAKFAVGCACAQEVREIMFDPES